MIRTRDPFHAFLDRPPVPVAHAEGGPLAGLRLAVKDIFDVEGWRTGCGNPAKLGEASPASRNAPLVQTLLDAGARFVGKTQTDELAFSLFGQNSHFPHPINPRAPRRITGGSSSGSAAAVAGGLADLAIGSDTGGSVRAPAGFCGLYGLRPTHGRLSLEGVMPLAPSLDTAGVFAANAETLGRLGAVLFGSDTGAADPVRLLRAAALDALVASEARSAYEDAAARVERALGPVQPLASTPFATDELYWCFRRVQGFEAWRTHGAWLSAADRGLGAGVKERFEAGAAVSPQVYAEEGARRDAFRAALGAALGSDGVLLLPTAPDAAPFADADADTLAAFRARALHLLCWAGLSGLPQLSLPLASVDGAPFGLSFLGPAGSEARLVALALRLERGGD